MKIPRVVNWNQPKNRKIATIPNKIFVISIEFLEMIEAILIFALPHQFLVLVAK